MLSQREEREERKRVMGDKKLISSSSSSSGNTSIYDTRSNNHHHHHPPSSSDEISQFLRHIFDRSSPLPPYYSPSTTTMTTSTATAIGLQGDPHADNSRCFVSRHHPPSDSTLLLSKRVGDFSEVLIGGSSAVGSGSVFGFSGGCQGNSSGTRVSSSSVGASGNETDEYDCESEEGGEAVVDEPLSSKSGPSRSSSKRCRAAEVHNLSEKRRRSRINEKMKALQSLIPNSNKTDKASMLDEAIEYLKQLQLQVQMLTMRNGINLHPLCLPGTSLHPLQLSQIRPGIPPEPNNDPLLNHTNQFASTSNAPEMINTVASSFALEPSIRNHFGPFPLITSPMEMSQEQRLNICHSNTNLIGEQSTFDGHQPDPKDRLT